MKPNNVNVVWKPLPGSQTIALAATDFMSEILYEGSRGPGKTDCQLMAFRKYVGRGYGSHWRGVIFDRQYKNLDDLISKSVRYFSKFGDGARFLRGRSDLRWMWPTGEELSFRQIQDASDYWNYHGQEYAFIGWNELCKFPTPELYDALMSCNRSSFLPSVHSPNKDAPLPPIPLVIFSTANPYGPGHNWVKRRFIDPAPPGIPVRTETEVFNPRTQKKEVVTKYSVRIFGSYRENIYLDPKYVADLENIREPNKRKAWLEGDWSVTAGGAFDDLWEPTIHIVPRFKVPDSWKLNRAMDWGTSKPFSVGFWAQANGEEALLPDGSIFCPKPGALIRFGEYYGCNPNEDNVGLNLTPTAVAKAIKEIEETFRCQGWIARPVRPGPADNSIYNDDRKDVDSVAQAMSRQGVEWERSNKNPGSRHQGLQLLRDRLEWSLTNSGPGIYFMEHCKYAIQQLPVLPRDPDDMDDVDSDAEDHLYDEVRYRVLDGAATAASNLTIKFPT